jgi:hypothetical protein
VQKDNFKKKEECSMSEWLTAGEMIDKLKIGEIAESKNFKAYFDKNFQLVSESKNTGVVTEFTIWSGTRNQKIWRIAPKYVTFGEAMIAHVKKATVTYHHDEELKYKFTPCQYGHFKQLGSDGISLGELINGNWTVDTL